MTHTPKNILDKYATLVIPREAVFTNSSGRPGIDQNYAKRYKPEEYTEKITCWIPPKSCIRIEFEDTPENNKRYISEVEASAKAMELDYCVTYHGEGHSPYLNIFNLKGIPVNEDNIPAKLLLVNELLPNGAKKHLDRTNLGWTYSPVIGHPHWKPKYNGAKHEIVAGTHPLDQENKYPQKLLRQLKTSKTKAKKNKNKYKGDGAWVEDFLLNYCLNNPIPKGNRNNVIEKNLAALLVHHPDRDALIKQYNDMQKPETPGTYAWFPSVIQNEYQVSPGELYNYIQNNNIPYEVPHTPNVADDPDVEDNELKQAFIRKPTIGIHKTTNHLLEEHDIITHKETRDIYTYNGIYYENGGERRLEAEIQRLLDEHATDTPTREIINQIRRSTYKPEEEFRTPPNTIILKNGVFNIDKWELTPHSKDIYARTYVDVNYKVDAKPGAAYEFIQQIVTPEQIPLLQELAGYCLLPEYPYQNAFMLLGEGANGKSTYLNMLIRLIGVRNTSNVSLHELAVNRFSAAGLVGKLANIFPDLPSKALKDTGLFKALSGGDYVQVERKYKDGYSYQNTAKLVFSANKIPETPDETDAFFRRWVLINFPFKFAGKDADPHLLEKISTREEKEWLLNWALHGLQRVIMNNGFSDAMDVESKRLMWQKNASPVAGYVIQCLEQDTTEEVTKDDMYNAYVAYCHENNLIVLNEAVFAKKLPVYANPIRRKRPGSGQGRSQVWVGWRILAEDEQEKPKDSGKKTLEDWTDTTPMS